MYARVMTSQMRGDNVEVGPWRAGSERDVKANPSDIPMYLKIAQGNSVGFYTSFL